MLKMPRPILVILVLIFIGQSVYYFTQLPERVASHFNIQGEPDSFSSKISFLIFDGVILFVLLVFMLSIPQLIRNLPASMINLPNKNYWLAPERREATISSLSSQFEWFCVALLALFIAVNQLVFQANLTKQNLSPTSFLIILGAFLLYVIIWTIKNIRQFSLPK